MARNLTREVAMHAADIMTPDVITATPDMRLPELIHLMLDHGISGVPIVEDGRLVGMVSEGDLMRRPEAGTEARRSHWLELITSFDRLAGTYVKTHGRKAGEVMTRDVVTVSDTTPIEAIIDLLESRRIKRVPVMRDGKLVGIVSRRNLLQAVVSRLESLSVSTEDRTIRDSFYSGLAAQPWRDGATSIIAVASDGVLHLWGYAPSGVRRQAIVVLAEGIPGVRGVEDHLEEPRMFDPMDRPNWPSPARP